MKNDHEPTDVGKQYAVAYAMHYTKKDLLEALGLYKSIIASHRDTREAVYAYSQIQNIVGRVVPEQELLDAQMDLALSHLRKQED